MPWRASTTRSNFRSWPTFRTTRPRAAASAARATSRGGRAAPAPTPPRAGRCRSSQPVVAQGHVPRLSIAGGEGDADDRRAHRRAAVGDDAQRELTGGAQLGRRARRAPPCVVTSAIVLLDRVGGRRVLVDQRAERQLREQLVAALARGAAIAAAPRSRRPAARRSGW